jgi:uncharacterized protein with GYD domain
MPRFLFIVTYTAEGTRGLVSAGGSARAQVVEKAAAGLGGRLVSFDFAFGSDDAYVIVELPDNETAATLALAVSSSSTTRLRTVVLLTPEQIDRAAQTRFDYVAPGRTG